MLIPLSPEAHSAFIRCLKTETDFSRLISRFLAYGDQPTIVFYGLDFGSTPAAPCFTFSIHLLRWESYLPCTSPSSYPTPALIYGGWVKSYDGAWGSHT